MLKTPSGFYYKIVGDFTAPYKIKGGHRFDLTKDGASWIDVFWLPKSHRPSKKEFEVLWNLHPEEKGKVKIMGKELETPRWQQSYLQEYWFSRMNHKSLPLPKEVQKYLDHANSFPYCKEMGVKSFNSGLLNWYKDGLMYIGSHSDDTGNLSLNKKKETLVWSISLQEEFGLSRIFRVKPKTGGNDRLDIRTGNGVVVVMGGTCQNTHKHQVPKIGLKNADAYGRRINITFRCFDS